MERCEHERECRCIHDVGAEALSPSVNEAAQNSLWWSGIGVVWQRWSLRVCWHTGSFISRLTCGGKKIGGKPAACCSRRGATISSRAV